MSRKPSSCAQCVDGVPVVKEERDTFTGKVREVWLCRACAIAEDEKPKPPRPPRQPKAQAEPRPQLRPKRRGWVGAA